jgi:ABC-type transporter Mla subunit MlaD
MRRIAAIVVLCAALTALFVAGSAAGGDEGSYEVRAIFDNAAFTVTGEDVRIAGAKVGSVSDIDITDEDEAALENGEPDPGKAVIVMQIDDPAFQDFREDASCLIRPQSLIGEKFVECEPTQPRAPGTEIPPELSQIPEGEPGEGQYLLPLERNGKTVDVDLVNDIMKRPYPDRFRLILNDLGAGFAARGEELAEIIERSNPALRELNRVLAILARQNKSLANLATDGDAIVTALARRRENVAGFINSSTVVGEATAERRAELSEGFAKLPGFLRELRSTMTELQAFSEAATPVFGDLGAAAPSLTRLNEVAQPFSRASTRAFVSLGNAAKATGAPLAASDPVIRQIRSLAKDGAPTTKKLGQFLSSIRKTDGFQYLFRTIFGLSGTVNSFDQYGHFLRALVPLQNCFDYTSTPQSGCSAKFPGSIDTTKAELLEDEDKRRAKRDRDQEAETPDADRGAEDEAGDVDSSVAPAPAEPAAPTAPETVDPGAPDVDAAPNSPQTTPPSEGEVGVQSGPRFRAARSLLDFLIGVESNEPGKRGRGKR